MDWKDVIRGVAPTLVGALATPAAGMAVKVLADAVLGGSSGDPVQDEATLAGALANGMTPEVRIKVIEAEAALKAQAHEIRKLLIEQDVAMYAADAKDRDSARRAAVESRQQLLVLTFGVLIFVFVVGIEGYVLMRGLPTATNPELLGRILGTLDATLLAAVYYIFGSSASSARKDLR